MPHLPSQPARVARRLPAATRQVLLELHVADLGGVSHTQPGQYVAAGTPEGTGWFALVNPPGDPVELLVRDGDGAAGALYRAAPGTEFTLGGAQGFGFPLTGVRPGTPVLLVAGGTGIAPLVPLLGAVVERGAVATLLYGVRDRGGFALLERLRGAHRTTLFVSRDVPEPPEVAGRVTDALAGDALPWTGLVAFLSGPPGMVTAARDKLLALGTRGDNVRVNF
ncbi:MAG: FAD-dependent oxidoreductase [Deltaproteobacteria bacterium]|nr:FAD-dependent oxidoreductase [Deltaproteobacteria bacterium]